MLFPVGCCAFNNIIILKVLTIHDRIAVVLGKIRTGHVETGDRGTLFMNFHLAVVEQNLFGQFAVFQLATDFGPDLYISVENVGIYIPGNTAFICAFARSVQIKSIAKDLQPLDRLVKLCYMNGKAIQLMWAVGLFAGHVAFIAMLK